MPELVPDSCKFGEELSIGDLLPVSLAVLERNPNRAESSGPGAKVGQHDTALAGGGMSVKVATREAASPELFSDSPQLVNDYLARQGINPSPFKCELRAIHLHVALHAV
jgi:hypothetical protein